MRYICSFALLISLVQDSYAQQLSFHDLQNILKLSIIEADEVLVKDGYTFFKKENVDGTAEIQHSYSYDGGSYATAKVLQKSIWNSNPQQSYCIRYITLDLSDYQSLRNYVIDSQFTRLDKDVSEVVNYSKDDIDVSFQVSHRDDKPFYIITLYSKFNRIMIDIAKKVYYKNSRSTQ